MSKVDVLLRTLIDISISGHLDHLLEFIPFDPKINSYRFGLLCISKDMVDSMIQRPEWCLENWSLNGEPLTPQQNP